MMSAQTPAAAPKAKPAPAATPAPAAAPGTPAGDQVVMSIGNEKITARDFEGFIQGLPDQYKAAAQGQMKRQIAEQYAQVKVMAQEARKRGLDKDPSVRSQIEFQSENLLAGALFRKLQEESAPNDQALQKAFEARKGEYERAQARHILIRFKGSAVPLREGQKDLTEEEALAKVNELRKRILGGEDFAAVAKAESDDTGSGSNGGDLGPVQRGQMVPEFEKAVYALPVGQVSEPVKTQFGYHLIRVDKRDSQTFEQAKADLERKLKPEAARAAAEALKQQANIKLDDAYFGPPAPPQGAPQPGVPATPAPK